MPLKRRVMWTDDGFMRLPGLAVALWRACATILFGTVLVLVAGLATRSLTLLFQVIPLGGLAALLRVAVNVVRPRGLHCDRCGRHGAVEGRRDGIRQPPGWKVVERMRLSSDEVAFHEVYCDRCTPWARKTASRRVR